MKITWQHFLIALTFLATAHLAQAQVAIKPGDTIQKQIAAHKGKKLTVRLQSGEELTGTVKEATNELLHLGELSGKEFFDAVIDISKVSAILVRNK